MAKLKHHISFLQARIPHGLFQILESSDVQYMSFINAYKMAIIGTNGSREVGRVSIPSSCHANNVPLIYNPATTHITPQFHVVYDEGFTSVTSIPSHMEDTLVQRLLEKTYWTYDHRNDNSVDTYDFPTFWSQTSTPTILHKGSKKRIIDTIPILDNTTTIGNVSEPNDYSHNIPSPRAVSASAGTIQTSLFPAAVSASVDIPQDIPQAEAVSAFEGAVHNTLNTGTVSASVDIPQDIPQDIAPSAEAVSALEGAVHHTLTTGIVSVPEDKSLPMNRVADVLINEGAANGTIPLGATSSHEGVSPALPFTPCRHQRLILNILHTAAAPTFVLTNNKKALMDTFTFRKMSVRRI
jgi:hypothetical protein